MKQGTVDYRQLQKLRDNFAKLTSSEMDKFCKDTSKELAGRLLGLVIPATPRGKYPPGTGKNGGTLRRGWTAKNAADATPGADPSAAEIQAHAQALPVRKGGSSYSVEVVNPVYYASYVEFGHRTRNGGGQGWVSGRLFLTKSEETLENIAPAVVEKKLAKVLLEAFNV